MATPTPTGYATVNPFIITRDADGLIAFLTRVFDAVDRPAARTIDDDGLLLHAELQVGEATIMFAERKPGWPHLPALLQVYVTDVTATLERAARGGAEVVTRPTSFYGDVFSRFLDPWGNLWWVYSTDPTVSGEWSDDGFEEGTDADATDAWEHTPELTYIHDTLLATIPRLAEG